MIEQEIQETGPGGRFGSFTTVPAGDTPAEGAAQSRILVETASAESSPPCAAMMSERIFSRTRRVFRTRHSDGNSSI
jgi:hypothetical protein